jgi:hypothetical protein
MTIGVAIENEFADGFEQFLKSRGVGFEDFDIIKAASPRKRPTRFFDVVCVSVQEFSKIAKAYFDSLDSGFEIETNSESVTVEKKDGTEKMDDFVTKHSKFRFYFKVKL